jgi:malonyl-CoA O-methyltransferase
MQNSFENISPQQYSECSIVARESAMQIISRLDLISLQPKVIVDVGCGVAESSDLLKKRYGDAEVLAIDANFNFLHYAQQNQSSKIRYFCADAHQLPVKEYSVDLIFANLLLPWCHDIYALIHSWQRVLKPNGLVMFSTLGPDTLRELPQHSLQLMDMHNVGDALTQAGLIDPVLDVDYLTLTYREQKQLTHELQVTGCVSMTETIPEIISALTYEIVYGHAWGRGHFIANEQGEVRVPLSVLRR